uniref:Thioesterase n=1 Tax=Strongyloides venezuelensis TaxID=75913 RepID=A0A0K0G1M7_STRVS
MEIWLISYMLPSIKINLVRLSEIRTFLGKAVQVVAVVDIMKEPVDKITSRYGNLFYEFTRDLLRKPVILKDVKVGEFGGVGELTYVSVLRIIKLRNQGIVQDISDWYARKHYNIQISNLQSVTNFDKNVILHSAISVKLATSKRIWLTRPVLRRIVGRELMFKI